MDRSIFGYFDAEIMNKGTLFNIRTFWFAIQETDVIM
jgi:hypothetical protein